MELLKNLEGMSADEQMTAVVELQKAAMKTLEDQKQASIGKSAELVIQGLKKIKSDFEAKFDSLNYDIQTKVASLKDGEQGLQGPKGEQGDRGLDGSNGRDGRDGKNGKDGLDGVDGVGVRDAKIDFDGSLVISLTDGREINCGEVVSVDVAKQIQKVTHNIQTGSGGDSQTVLDAIAALQATIATYGTMATQNKTSVDIEGGTIDNTTIGATTPSTGVFTTLTARGQTLLGGASGSQTVQVNTTTNTGQYTLFTRDNTNNVQLIGVGGSANLGFYSNGGGNLRFYTAPSITELQFQVERTASAVNYVQVTGAATASGTGPVISAQGSDTNVNLTLQSKGTGYLNVLNNRTNYFQFYGGNTGQSPTMYAWGTDTNIDLNLTTKGTGSVNLNTGNGIAFKVGDAGATSVDFIQASSSSFSRPSLVARPVSGSGTINLALSSFGSGSIQFATNNLSQEQLRVAHTASAVNYVQVTGAATGLSPVISAQGSDANIQIQLQAKGTGLVRFTTGGGLQAYVSDTVSAVNYVGFTGGATGFGPRVFAAGSDTNIPLVLQPKGTGALQAQQTDSTATGGNARGANAVDWQTSRASASQVASGVASVISGGINNTSTGNYNFVGGGQTNAANFSFGGIASGAGNTVTANYSFIGGGNNNSILNSAASNFAFIGAGTLNVAHGIYNVTVGGQTNSGTSASAVTTQSSTMNGTTAVTLAASNANIKVGQYITGTSIGSDTYVAAISGTSLTLSKVASGSSTSTLSFYTPHGVVVGGGNNQATGSYSFIGGGGDAGTAANRNVASGAWSAVVGGGKNTASGIASFIGGGGFDGSAFLPNTASGISAVIVGGLNNTASANYAFIGNGGTNTASAANAFIGCGYSNTASGTASSVSAGNNNTANGANSSIVSGQFGTTRSINSNAVFSSATITTSLGVSQTALVVLGKQTTDATATVITSDGAGAGTTNQVILPNNSAYYFRGEVVSGVTGGGNTKGWFIEGVIKRGANAASTALVGTPTVTSSYADAGASTWTIGVTADTTNGGLAVTFTGQASTTIRTVAQIRTTEMTY